jgi:hypothetical protein
MIKTKEMRSGVASKMLAPFAVVKEGSQTAPPLLIA